MITNQKSTCSEHDNAIGPRRLREIFKFAIDIWNIPNRVTKLEHLIKDQNSALPKCLHCDNHRVPITKQLKDKIKVANTDIYEDIYIFYGKCFGCGTWWRLASGPPLRILIMENPTEKTTPQTD
jgi:hypothetical protein